MIGAARLGALPIVDVRQDNLAGEHFEARGDERLQACVLSAAEHRNELRPKPVGRVLPRIADVNRLAFPVEARPIHNQVHPVHLAVVRPGLKAPGNNIPAPQLQQVVVLSGIQLPANRARVHVRDVPEVLLQLAVVPERNLQAIVRPRPLPRQVHVDAAERNVALPDPGHRLHLARRLAAAFVCRRH